MPEEKKRPSIVQFLKAGPFDALRENSSGEEQSENEGRTPGQERPRGRSSIFFASYVAQVSGDYSESKTGCLTKSTSCVMHNVVEPAFFIATSPLWLPVVGAVYAKREVSKCLSGTSERTTGAVRTTGHAVEQ